MVSSFFNLIPYVQCFWNKKKLFEVTFFVTNRCNFKCPFCFNDDKSKEMTLAEISMVSLKLGKFYRLLLSGGEPFVRKDIAEICSIFIKQNKVKHISIPTNGFYTNDIINQVRRMVESNPKVHFNISLSLDSLFEKRDAIVGVNESFVNLEKTMHRLHILKIGNSNLSVGTITTQCVENERDLYVIYGYAKKTLGVDNFGFNIARGTKASLTKYKEFTDFLLKDNKSKMGFPFLRAKCKLIYDTVANKSLFRCQAGLLRKVIGADGKISPCETIKFGGTCSNCFHECDIGVSEVFNPRNLWTLLNYR
jgi:MoaA/NifB/PqqE/SkfB family radical SAM enzyme